MKRNRSGEATRPAGTMKWMAWVVAGVLFSISSLAYSESWSSQRCEAKINRMTGRHVKCLLDAEAVLSKQGHLAKYEKRVAQCEARYSADYARALAKWPEACPRLDDSTMAMQVQVGSHVDSFAGHLRSLISDTAPTPQAGEVTLYNRCDVPLKFMSPSNPATLNGIVIPAKGHKDLSITGDLNVGNNNTIHVAPQTTASQCEAAQCPGWADIQYQPFPDNQAQRAGFMWEAPNEVQAAYCQATNAGAKQCSGEGGATPCCGPKMNFDSTFGTLWEITPFSGDQDFVNLSTNFGSGPHAPPTLCSAQGADPDDCVAMNANVFFNVPVKIEMHGGACSCGSLSSQSSIQCLKASCSDAYQHPTDPKQCVCSSGGERAYLVTYCPQGSPLPELSSAFIDLD